VNERAVRTSLHEGGHAATSAMLGVPILGLRRLNGDGLVRGCTSTDVENLGDDLRDAAIRRAAVLVTPLVMGCDGTSDDVAKFAALGEAGVPLQVGHQTALDLIATEEHLELRWLVADKLMTRLEIIFDAPVASPEELRAALR
jgi:hypothetical protein